ncbi:nucleolar and coiled-body phosphoprotein 1-like [Zingiber officinale]|uniref:nucleolar and coiled-body phosphoprotein 1-like n=1 Tax=Zingiber officinale TaxID=94328 RepID=UPI001C4B6A51|nr:nucleolar and coiled-body phosphoprotein 1-like [Zingiber officinale]
MALIKCALMTWCHLPPPLASSYGSTMCPMGYRRFEMNGLMRASVPVTCIQRSRQIRLDLIKPSPSSSAAPLPSRVPQPSSMLQRSDDFDFPFSDDSPPSSFDPQLPCKKKAVALEAAAAKEMEQLGIAPVGSHEDESEAQVGESAAQASPMDATADATSGKEPAVQEENFDPDDELPLNRKRRRVEKPLRSATSAVQASERTGTASPHGQAPSVEALSSDQTPSQLEAPAAPIEAAPVASLPPAPRRVLRSGILSTFSSPASDPLASAQTTPGQRRTIRATLHLPTKAFMAESDRPTTPEHMITMKGPLAKMWADARARVAMIPLDKLADNHMQQSTGRWVEEIAVSNHLAMVEEELKRLKSQGGPSSSRGPSYAELQKELDKTKDLLEAERKKTADQAYMLDQLDKKVKSYDLKIELATTQKNTAIADLEKKNVEARALEQRVNELAELLEGEQNGRSTEVTKLKDDLKELQGALDASRAAFKEY